MPIAPDFVKAFEVCTLGQTLTGPPQLSETAPDDGRDHD